MKAKATRRKSARKVAPASKAIKMRMKKNLPFIGKNSVLSFYVNRVVTGFARAVK